MSYLVRFVNLGSMSDVYKLQVTTQRFWILQAYYRYLPCENLKDFSTYSIVLQLDINSPNQSFSLQKRNLQIYFHRPFVLL